MFLALTSWPLGVIGFALVLLTACAIDLGPKDDRHGESGEAEQQVSEDSKASSGDAQHGGAPDAKLPVLVTVRDKPNL